MWQFHHLYLVPPIDVWFGWQKLEDFLHALPEWDGFSEDDNLAERLSAEIGRVMSVAHDTWGDDAMEIVEGPFVAGFPQSNMVYGDGDLLLAWKQKNNGMTFIASPQVLAHLHDCCLDGYERI